MTDLHDKEKGRKEIKLSLVWSLDESHIYIYDEIEQYNLVDIKMDGIGSKEQKISVLKEIVKHL